MSTNYKKKCKLQNRTKTRKMHSAATFILFAPKNKKTKEYKIKR